MLGGSTGGWEALASVVLYPDDFNYAVAACPDPIGFTSYTTVNLYKDRNAYYYDAPFKRTPRADKEAEAAAPAVEEPEAAPGHGALRRVLRTHSPARAPRAAAALA